MDLNRTERSLCFPFITRFAARCSSRPRTSASPTLCVRAYNDWMIDEWCGDSGGRLMPLCLIPLWDPPAAADEIRRNAARGCRAITFPEMPHHLRLPSIHHPDRYWDPVFEACDETGTVLCMHIGSGSRMVETSPFALRRGEHGDDVCDGAVVDGRVARIRASWYGSRISRSCTPRAKSVGCRSSSSESTTCYTHTAYAELPEIITQPPSSYVPGRVYGCFFDDNTGVSTATRSDSTRWSSRWTIPTRIRRGPTPTRSWNVIAAAGLAGRARATSAWQCHRYARARPGRSASAARTTVTPARASRSSTEMHAFAVDCLVIGDVERDMTPCERPRTVESRELVEIASDEQHRVGDRRV